MLMKAGGGFCAFLATLNPLESLRKYLLFGHRRRQDLLYRERAEARKLDLENERQELAILERRVKIAKQLGATKKQLQPLCKRVLGGYHVEKLS